jgi:acyl-coenzyme A thioesterase PaaI-like protein
MVGPHVSRRREHHRRHADAGGVGSGGLRRDVDAAGPARAAGTGVFAAGALMQLADVAATSLYFQALEAEGVEQPPFPLSIQISMNLLRNTNEGSATSESRFLHRGRSMVVVESKVRDDAGKLLCTVVSTHVPSPARPG